MGRRRRQSGHRQAQLPFLRVEPKPVGVSSTPATFAHRPRQRYSSIPPEELQPGAPQHRYNEATAPSSPVSSRSAHSHGSLGHSVSTSYTSYLADARHLSPDPPTPTNSTISTYNSAHHATNGSGRPRQYQSFMSSGTSDPDVQMTDVLGIDVRFSSAETQQYVGSQPQYVSDRGFSPTTHQRYPHMAGPWAPLPFRHEDLYMGEEGAGPVREEVVPEDAQTQSSREKRGGRTRPLSPSARKEASDVRRVGACLRCTIMREKCDLQTSCHTCLTKERRKFPKTCIRAHADWERLKSIIFPLELTSSLRRDKLFRYMSKGAFTLSPRQPFKIPLDLGVGTPLQVMVQEFHALTTEIEHTYRIKEDGSGNKIYCQHQVWSPPINVFFKNGEYMRPVQSLKHQINTIFENVLGDEKGWINWTMEYFPSKEENFQTDILGWIGKYYRKDIHEHGILKTGLSLLWYEHLLLRSFEIPPEARPMLEKHLESCRPAELSEKAEIAPETINRFLKGVILPMAEDAARSVLETLHEKMFKMAVNLDLSKARTDIALCLAFILLIFLGRTQHALVLLASTSAKESDGMYSLSDAKAKIQEMEDSVTEYLLSFHKYTLSRKSSRSAKVSSGGGEERSAFEMHARDFDLVGRFRGEVGVEYAGIKPEDLDVGPLNYKTFRHMNVRRLCWKLFQNFDVDASN
ncbi:hypothetical protein PV08_04980 [Exophiala spinifera]|uniref:Zn(2)-C6 fungal-type domain-containing protein n=1 Tax=Exophiala spinifera TaxID=91928 RepID=A0A0D2BGM7_9EURO|nr:uncharacterized protein PV08_04980 [Exophiala spinifera]KIW17785.1 hypothetical protein PV08_04980 [Exophiala spinifera]